MKFKLYFGISIFNVIVLLLAATYGIVTKFSIVSASDIEFIRYFLIGYAIGAPILWLFLVNSVDCPYCSEKALPFFNERAMAPAQKQSIPAWLRPFSFMVDREFFANHCYCVACKEKVYFGKNNDEDNKDTHSNLI